MTNLLFFSCLFFTSQSKEGGSQHQAALPSRDLRPGRTDRSARVLCIWKVGFQIGNRLIMCLKSILGREALWPVKHQ